MTQARVLADLVATGGELADGAIAVAEVSGAAPLASPTFTGTVGAAAITATGTVAAPTVNASTTLQIGGTGVTASAAELNFVGGVTSAIQTQMNTKQQELTPNVITGNTTASKDNRYFLNGSALTLTLPSSASAGDTIAISEMGGNANNIIGRNGHKIQSLAEDMTIDTAFAAFQLQYVNATVGWAISQ
tara:strand:- start:603 stop:1169 length:567 start_codon:yes stop_codon:yes gene_type:complete